MTRQAGASKPIVYKTSHLAKFRGGMTSNDLQILTGWSRATVYRRIGAQDFPKPVDRVKGRPIWNPVEILEWVSIHNLRTVLGSEEALEFERALADRSFADPVLRLPIGRAIERDATRRIREKKTA
jgi:predicted DNA-binding transcriptional regulator AlpA